MYRPSQLSNKYFYNEYINVKFLKPIGINTWLMYLSIDEKPNMSQLYSFIFHYLEDKKLKKNHMEIIAIYNSYKETINEMENCY